MSAKEAARRTSWARFLAGWRLHDALPFEIAPRGLPGLFSPAAFERFYGPGITGFFAVDDVSPKVTAIALVEASSVRRLLAKALGESSPTRPLASPLDELEAGAAHFAAARVVHVATGGALRLGAVLTERASIQRALGKEIWDHLGLELTFDGEVHRVDLLRRGPHGTTRKRGNTIGAAVPVPLSLSLGFTSLSLAELGSLAVDDAVLIEHAAPEGEAFFFVPGTTYARRAVFRDRAIVVGPPTLLPIPTYQGAMNDEITRPLDAARVEVSAEIARLSMRVGELDRLAEGEVLALGVDVGAEVVLRAGDVVVARGELVDVDGRLAVLIRALGR